MAKIEFNKSEGKIVKVFCSICKNSNRHKVLTSVDTSGKEQWEDDNWFYWTNIFQVIECQGCGQISFRNESSNSEDYFEDGPGFTELIYPKRTKDTWNTKDFFNIPYILRNIYRETIDCFNNGNFILSGAGVRALVEGLCKENEIIDGVVEITSTDGKLVKKRLDNIQGKINGLFEQGKLTKENSEILHELRFLGNSSIHELKTPSKEELSLAIEIIENVFDTLYEIPDKAMRLKNKRLRKSSK